MSVMEIVLLIIGAAVFVISFFVPEGKDAKGSGLDRKAIDAAVMDSIGNAKGILEGVVDEAVAYAIEKSERSMDRVTNEKMEAVNEYAAAVLESINRNHQEVMFLYDMVNSKSVDLKNTVREAQKVQIDATREMRRRAEIAPAEPQIMPLVETAPVIDTTGYSDPQPEAEVQPAPETVGAGAIKGLEEVDIISPKSPKSDSTKRRSAAKSEKKGVATPSVDITLNAQSPAKNKNDKILELHRQGKSNVEVARELGLGMGEVKLVIDLFEGAK